MSAKYTRLGQLKGKFGVSANEMNKSNEPLLIKKTSFEVKHCKIETVFLLSSAQAGKLKKTYIWNTKISGIR